MNKLSITRISLLSAVATAALLALPAQAAAMSKADYSAAKSRISSTYKADDAACASQAGNARDICVLQAKGRQKVARAELEFAYSAKPADENRIRVAKAEASYAVAKERCDDLAGNPKDVCRAEAKAAQTKALADAKLGRQVSDARTDAAQDKRDAEFKVATEKCDALAGDAKTSCMTMAKAQFGKT